MDCPRRIAHINNPLAPWGIGANQNPSTDPLLSDDVAGMEVVGGDSHVRVPDDNYAGGGGGN